MSAINWYDWISPTNPIAAIFLGLLIVIIITFVVWLEEKTFKLPLIVFLSGAITTVLGVLFLNVIGFYS
ncbi:hypothetical protein LGQ02_03610 [Bacillus shivajii]|uniref:hypothetical protein n=1 Tax=Bacillus shivajii TaxID=1983719 RepID=UPI001CFB02AC|nr:hypothetical protein [Bacillus shivajii]UCZ53882.1 hypothetical protein LGQ02_03610 [Bacillus shivajii]